MIHALQIAVILFVAPLAQGVINTLRARLQGRPGPPLLQPYRDLAKLWGKESLVPEHSSMLVLLTPGLVAGAAAVVAALVPVVFPVASTGNVQVIALALTLALGRFALVLVALDTRSSFEAMAASREMTFAALTEAPLIVALVTLPMQGSILASILACAALVCVNLSETARLPVDNQQTHYELTMIHEGLMLEYSGWHLALLQYASYVRQLALLLLAALFLPGGSIATIAWLAVFLLAAPLLERSIAKMRLFEVPSLFATATILALASIGMHVLGGTS